VIFSSLAAWETVSTLPMSILAVIIIGACPEDDPICWEVGDVRGLEQVRRVRARSEHKAEISYEPVGRQRIITEGQ
jgi:hypothetical protein